MGLDEVDPVPDDFRAVPGQIAEWRDIERGHATRPTRIRWEGVDRLPWLHHGHSTTRVVVHMVWATHRRAPSLLETVDARLAKLVADKCGELGCRAVAVGNAADHVHALVVLAPTASVASLAHRLKGATSRILGMQLERPFGWQAGYFAESVVDVARVARYVRGQRQRHRGSARAEGWEGIGR